MIEAQELTGYISQEKVLTGELSKTIEVLKPITQEKEVIPTKETQIIEPDKDFTGLSKVTVQAIPNEYIVPSGEIEFTQNGTYDVTDKASAKVNIKEKVLGTKTITSNGTYKAIDDNLDGYSEVEVATSGVDINEYFNLTKRTRGNYTYYIKKLPLIDTSDYTSFTQFCYGVSGLEEFPEIDTSNGQSFYRFIGDCPNIKRIPRFNFGKANSISSMLYHGYSPFNLDYMGGFENLGMAYNTSASENNNNYQLRVDFFKLTHESLMNVINNLYDIKTKGVKPQQLILGTTNLAKLTAEEVAIGTSKGWSIS